MYRIGIDVGGTFTDLVAVDDAGDVTLAKTPSTPADQSIGVMAGLEKLAESLDLDRATLLQQTDRIVHGTTVATNSLLERKGAKVGLLTTEGHRDVLEMREGLKDDRYNMRIAPPETLAPRHLRLGVRERIRPTGEIETPLDEDSVRAAVAHLIEEGVTSVAICYLHAYRDSRHEVRTREIVREMMPDAYICISAEVFPQIKEYERVSTTVVNAYVGPALDRYLNRLNDRLQEAGFENSVLIILSHGGVAPIAEAIRLSAATVLSGPAGGVSGARHSARIAGVANLIPFDMGGTSTDISLIVDGEPALSSFRGIAGQRIALPSLDIVTLGAGGGSIAHVDTAGALPVGPESAGADPGPACYGRGGTRPTVTDASVVRGFLDAENFLGGTATLDSNAAHISVQTIGETLSISTEEAAEGIHRIVNTNMAEGIRLVSVRRGVDPRQFALLSFGGAAGINITDVARQLEIKRVLAPRVASVLSAWGMLATDLRFEVSRTHIGDTSTMDVGTLRALYTDMEGEGRTRLAENFDGPVRISRAAEMRYGEQIFEIDVNLDGLDWEADDLLEQITGRFHARHEELYTYSMPDQEVVLVNARLAAIGELPALPEEPLTPEGDPVAPRGERAVWMGGRIMAPVYDFDRLPAGQEIDGPAIVESDTTTVVLRTGDRAKVTSTGWLDIRIDA